MDTNFYIGEVDGPTLLGLPSMLSHKIITVNKRPDQAQDASPASSAFHAVDQKVHFTSLDVVRNEFPDRFEGISCFKGTASSEGGILSVVERGRKFALHLISKLKTELEKMVKLKVITPVTEPTNWASNLAYSQKANGDLRICLDPGALNKVLRRTYHRAPRLEEITHKMCSARIFNKFDAKYAYWGIMLDEESADQENCIHQEKMDMVLEENIRQLMTAARKHGLVFNPEKCEIGKPTIKFFGSIYDREGVHPDPGKVKVLQEIPAPRNIEDLGTFLGAINQLGEFIQNLSHHTEPLRALMKNDSHSPEGLQNSEEHDHG